MTKLVNDVIMSPRCSRRTTFITILLLLTYTFSSLPASSSTEYESITLASWNIRILSDNSRDENELEMIVEILSKFDIIAVQEVRDSTVLDRIIRILPEGWTYRISDPVGRGVKERYAFIFDTSRVKDLGSSYLFVDPDDLFIREPFIGHFVSGEIDFTLVTFHALFGDSITERRYEISLLDEVIASVDMANGSENDVILLGDFNMPADDWSWQIITHRPTVTPDMLTTITDTSSYDNIWIPISDHLLYSRISAADVYPFDTIHFSDDDKAASLAVSDHRPISVNLVIEYDQDASGNYVAAAGFETSEPAVVTKEPASVHISHVIKSPTSQEAVTIRNTSSELFDISGWTLGDLNAPQAYTFSQGTRISTGAELVIGHDELGFIINDTKEELFLKDAAGRLIDSWSD